MIQVDEKVGTGLMRYARILLGYSSERRVDGVLNVDLYCTLCLKLSVTRKPRSLTSETWVMNESPWLDTRRGGVEEVTPTFIRVPREVPACSPYRRVLDGFLNVLEIGFWGNQLPGSSERGVGQKKVGACECGGCFRSFGVGIGAVSSVTQLASDFEDAFFGLKPWPSCGCRDNGDSMSQ